MKNGLIILIMVLNGIANAGWNVGVGLHSTSEEANVSMSIPDFGKTVNGSISNSTSKGYFSLGYDYSINEQYSLDSKVIYMKSSSNTILVAAESIKYSANEKVSLKAGLNYSHALDTDDLISVTSKKADLGYQLGASYKINDNVEVEFSILNTKNAVNYKIDNQAVNGFGEINYEQKSNKIGLNFSF